VSGSREIASRIPTLEMTVCRHLSAVGPRSCRRNRNRPDFSSLAGNDDQLWPLSLAEKKSSRCASPYATHWRHVWQMLQDVNPDVASKKPSATGPCVPGSSLPAMTFNSEAAPPFFASHVVTQPTACISFLSPWRQLSRKKCAPSRPARRSRFVVLNRGWAKCLEGKLWLNFSSLSETETPRKLPVPEPHEGALIICLAVRPLEAIISAVHLPVCIISHRSLYSLLLYITAQEGTFAPTCIRRLTTVPTHFASGGGPPD